MTTIDPRRGNRPASRRPDTADETRIKYCAFNLGAAGVSARAVFGDLPHRPGAGAVVGLNLSGELVTSLPEDTFLPDFPKVLRVLDGSAEGTYWVNSHRVRTKRAESTQPVTPEVLADQLYLFFLGAIPRLDPAAIAGLLEFLTAANPTFTRPELVSAVWSAQVSAALPQVRQLNEADQFPYLLAAFGSALQSRRDDFPVPGSNLRVASKDPLARAVIARALKVCAETDPDARRALEENLGRLYLYAPDNPPKNLLLGEGALRWPQELPRLSTTRRTQQRDAVLVSFQLIAETHRFRSLREAPPAPVAEIANAALPWLQPAQPDVLNEPLEASSAGTFAARLTLHQAFGICFMESSAIAHLVRVLTTRRFSDEVIESLGHHLDGHVQQHSYLYRLVLDKLRLHPSLRSLADRLVEDTRQLRKLLASLDYYIFDDGGLSEDDTFSRLTH